MQSTSVRKLEINPMQSNASEIVRVAITIGRANAHRQRETNARARGTTPCKGGAGRPFARFCGTTPLQSSEGQGLCKKLEINPMQSNASEIVRAAITIRRTLRVVRPTFPAIRSPGRRPPRWWRPRCSARRRNRAAGARRRGRAPRRSGRPGCRASSSRPRR
jgi:hypothetical protein